MPEKQEKKIKYEDDEILTPENKELLKTLADHEGWKVMVKVIEALEETARDEICNYAINGYSSTKTHDFSIYEIQGAFVQGIKRPIVILETILHEDEVKDAVDEVNKAEQDQLK